MRFRGPKGELPKGSDGSYGTSLPMWKCMAEGSDVIIAWKQNGRLLDPDHGFPVSCATRDGHKPLLAADHPVVQIPGLTVPKVQYFWSR